jgi:D-amino-acid dehydrogenase
MSTVIVGGGIVGFFTAYFLQKSGVQVTLLDKGDFQENCSTGNAGMIVPSHIVPLASPGMVSKGLMWMFSAKSPFYIHPSLDRDLIRWCYYFFRAANTGQVNRALPVLKSFSFFSKALYMELQQNHAQADFSFQEKGLLMLYRTAAMEKEETEFAEIAMKQGVEAQVLSRQEAQKLEPHQELDVRGAVYFPGDAHLDPAKLYAFMKDYLLGQGVKFIKEAEVTGFEKEGAKVKKVLSSKGDFDCDDLVICSGAWSSILADKLGFRLPMIGGKGYSFTKPNLPGLQQASILTEAKVSQSPYPDFVRFGGTMEIARPNTKVNIKRVEGIFSAIHNYYPGISLDFPKEDEIWKGIRPCSPDGLPYIGPAPGLSNVYVGAGHAMMGLSLAPATGKYLSDLLTGETNTAYGPYQLFKVGRYQ